MWGKIALCLVAVGIYSWIGAYGDPEGEERQARDLAGPHRRAEARRQEEVDRALAEKRPMEAMKAQRVRQAGAQVRHESATDGVRRAKAVPDLPPPSAAVSYDTLGPGQRWRRKADEQMKLRDQASRLSREAYQRNEGAEAKELSEVRQGHDAQMRAYHAKAAAEIFAHHNPEYHVYAKLASNRNRCDLHGLYLKEAMQYAKDHLATCKNAGVDRTCFVTGIGNRSNNGPKLKPALEELLDASDLTVQKEVPNKGCITVHFRDDAM